MSGAAEKETHFLALKVMRLTRPTLFGVSPILSEPQDLTNDLLNSVNKKLAPELKNFFLGNLLMLPRSFGDIYLGETFTSYISVHNESDQLVKDVFLKADLQTSSQMVSLATRDSQISAQILEKDDSMDAVIHYEIKEIGRHMLVCNVNYTIESGEKLFFRKFFTFEVLKPLDVKTKFYNAEDENVNFRFLVSLYLGCCIGHRVVHGLACMLKDYLSDEVYLEAQVQNMTSTPVCLEQVSFEPSSYFMGTQMNTVQLEEKTESVFGSINCLHPMDSRQFLYCLTPKPEAKTNPKALKEVTNLGKLDIVWRTNMGDRGRLQTSQLQRMAPGYGDIRLSVEEIPNVVQLEKPFTVVCRVVNCCERAMDLQLTLNKNANQHLQWVGISGRSLGKLAPDESLDIILRLIPTEQGLQTISGICLTDTFLKRAYDYDEVAQVFVEASCQNETNLK